MRHRRRLGATLSGRRSHKQSALADGRLTEQRVAKPLFPNQPTRATFHDKHRAAFRIESHVSMLQKSGSRSVIIGLNLPSNFTSPRIQRVKFMRSITAAYKQHSISISRSCDRKIASQANDPSRSTIGYFERYWLEITGRCGQS